MLIDNISNLEVYGALAINGIFTGLGAAVGTYIANKHVIAKTKKLVNKVRKIL